MTPVTSSEKNENTPQGRHPSFIPVDLPKKRRRQNKDENETPVKKPRERRKNGKFITNSIWTSAIVKHQNKKRYGVMSGFYGQDDKRNWTEIYELVLNEDIDFVYTLAVVRAIQKWKDDTSPLTVYTASRELILAISDGTSLPECADVRDKVISLVNGRKGTTQVRCVSTRVSECRKAHELASKLSVNESVGIRKLKDVNLNAEEPKKEEENKNIEALIKDDNEKEQQQKSTTTTNDEIIHQQNGKVVVEQKETIVEVEEQIVEEDVVMIDVKQNDNHHQQKEEKSVAVEEKTTIVEEKTTIVEEKMKVVKEQEDEEEKVQEKAIKLNGNASKDKGKEKEKEDIVDKQVDEIEDNLENSPSWSIGLNIRSLLDVLKSPFRRANSDVGSRS